METPIIGRKQGIMPKKMGPLMSEEGVGNKAYLFKMC